VPTLADRGVSSGQRNERRLINTELEGNCRSLILGTISVLTGETEENQEKFSQYCRSVDRDLNLGLPQFEARMLATLQR
jgi:hypothetical protein